jgi:hypothetical protein
MSSIAATHCFLTHRPQEMAPRRHGPQAPGIIGKKQKFIGFGGEPEVYRENLSEACY